MSLLKVCLCVLSWAVARSRQWGSGRETPVFCSSRGCKFQSEGVRRGSDTPSPESRGSGVMDKHTEIKSSPIPRISSN